jgi:hypothetical protein
MAIARQRGAQASLAGGGARTDEAWLVLRRAGARGRGNRD